MKKVVSILIFSMLSFWGYSQNGTKARSAKTGQYVTKDYAKKNSSTTVVEKTKPYNSSGTRRKK